MIKNDNAIRDKKTVWNRDWETVKGEYFWKLRHHYQFITPYLRGKILDLGCGISYLAGFVQPNEAWYTGVDISEVAINYSKSLFPGSSYHVLDASVETLPFNDNSFDTVVMSEVIEHLLDFQKLISEARRVSREYILISVPVDLWQDDHVWPVWEHEDLIREFSKLGKILEIKTNYEYNSNIVWIRK